MSSRVCNNCNMQVSENAKFCSGCGSDLQQGSKTQPKEQPTSVIKNAKKGFGIGTKIGFGIGMIFFIIIVIGAIANSSSNTSTNTDSSNVINQDKQAISLVQNYKGSNGNGLSIAQIITFIIVAAYPNENILDNPSTQHGWIALRDYDQQGNVWKVEFDFKTYRENVGIVWFVNMDTHSVYSGDTTAKNILDMTNIPSGSVSNSTLSQIHLT